MRDYEATNKFELERMRYEIIKEERGKGEGGE